MNKQFFEGRRAMGLFSGYCKLCFGRDISIFIAGAFTYMMANKIETGAHNGFTTLNIISIILEILFIVIMLSNAWINRNHTHKNF